MGAWTVHSGSLRSTMMRVFFFSSRRRHTRFDCDWSSDVCSSDLIEVETDKAVMGVTTPCPGEIAKIDAEVKGTYAVGAVLGYIEASETDAARFKRSEERRVGKECRSRWSPYH